MSDASSKPRVLLSILKYADLDTNDTNNLFTAISAGFGRFECDRLLKPSGVELMNLPHSANIEIGVLKRDRATGQKELLYHGLVPLSAIHPAFDPNRNSGTPAEMLDPWENWLGLFNADVNLKSQTAERLFQRCIEMGASSARIPRLLLRVQYLAPGTTATSTRHSPVASRPQASVERNFQPAHSPEDIESSRHWGGAVPQGVSGRSGKSSGHAPHMMVNSGGGPGPIARNPHAHLRPLPLHNGEQGPLPPTAGAPAKRIGPPSSGGAIGGSLGDPQAHNRPSSGVGFLLQAGARTGSMEVSATALSPGSQGHEGNTAPISPSGSTTPGTAQQSYEELMRLMEVNKAAWNEQRANLEAALREAERKAASNQPAPLSVRSEYEELIVVDNPGEWECYPMPQQQELQARQELLAAEAQERDLRMRVDDLQKVSEDLKVDNLHWKAQDAARQASELEFLERAGLVLARLGYSVNAPAPQDGLSAEAMRQQLEAVVCRLEELADAQAARSTVNTTPDTGTEVHAKQPAPSPALVEEALHVAMNKGEAGFEQWFAELDPKAAMTLSRAEGLVAHFRKVAALRCDASEFGEGQLMYTPDKTDPVDCLFAAQLLRLDARHTPRDIVRMGRGLYKFLPDGVRLQCFIERGRLMVLETLAGDDAGADSTPNDPRMAPEAAAKAGAKSACELAEYLTRRTPRPVGVAAG